MSEQDLKVLLLALKRTPPLRCWLPKPKQNFTDWPKAYTIEKYWKAEVGWGLQMTLFWKYCACGECRSSTKIWCWKCSRKCKRRTIDWSCRCWRYRPTKKTGFLRGKLGMCSNGCQLDWLATVIQSISWRFCTTSSSTNRSQLSPYAWFTISTLVASWRSISKAGL